MRGSPVHPVSVVIVIIIIIIIVIILMKDRYRQKYWIEIDRVNEYNNRQYLYRIPVWPCLRLPAIFRGQERFYFVWRMMRMRKAIHWYLPNDPLAERKKN